MSDDLYNAGTRGATRFGPFGRLALDPYKLGDVAGALVGMAKAPVEAAGRIMARGPVHPGDVDSSLVADALVAGPGALSPGYGRAAAGSVGVSGANILRRTDAIKLAREMKAAGHSDKAVAEALNERFAPIIDEGTQVSVHNVRTLRNNNFEVGAMGGRGTSNRLTADDVSQMMRELGYENVNVRGAKAGDTLYVRGDPPGNPPRSTADTPTVRVPDDSHLGRPASGREIGNRYDTGTPDPTRRKIDPGVYQNQAGMPFADPDALAGVLKWRRGDLVSPDMAPGRIRELPPLEQPAPLMPAGPIQDPRQLKLLAAGRPDIAALLAQGNQ